MSEAQLLSQVWQELRNVALVGSAARPWSLANAECDDGVLALLAQAGQTLRHEQQVLQAAGILAWARQAGQMCAQDDLALPGYAPLNQLPSASAAMAACLQTILHTDMQPCLPEFLNLSITQQVAAPAIYLPRLLDIGRQQVHLRAAIARVLDARGYWLASLNAQWKWVLGIRSHQQQVPDSWWSDGNLEQRCAWLVKQRNQDAEAARLALQQCFAQEKASARSSLLLCLRTGLCADDEVWLESLLDDKARGVRQAAMKLLADLPASLWRQRMRQRLHACMRWQVQAATQDAWLGRVTQAVKSLVGVRPHAYVLQLDLPETCDAAMLRDGLEEKPPAGTGQRAWWLIQMLQMMPVADWCALPQGVAAPDLPAMLAAFAESDWRELLMKAAQQSCILHRDAELAGYLLQDGHVDLALFRLVSAAEQKALLLLILRRLLREPAAIRKNLQEHQELLDAPDLHWDAELSTVLLQTLLTAILSCKNEHDSHRLRHWLLQFAVRLDLSSMQAWWAQQDNEAKAALSGFGTQFLPEKLEQLMLFRQQMLTAFAAPASPSSPISIL